jgi:hypothetical protein
VTCGTLRTPSFPAGRRTFSVPPRAGHSLGSSNDDGALGVRFNELDCHFTLLPTLDLRVISKICFPNWGHRPSIVFEPLCLGSHRWLRHSFRHRR